MLTDNTKMREIKDKIMMTENIRIIEIKDKMKKEGTFKRYLYIKNSLDCKMCKDKISLFKEIIILDFDYITN